LCSLPSRILRGRFLGDLNERCLRETLALDPAREQFERIRGRVFLMVAGHGQERFRLLRNEGESEVLQLPVGGTDEGILVDLWVDAKRTDRAALAQAVRPTQHDIQKRMLESFFEDADRIHRARWALPVGKFEKELAHTQGERFEESNVLSKNAV